VKILRGVRKTRGNGSSSFAGSKERLKTAWERFDAIRDAYRLKGVLMEDDFRGFWMENHVEIEQLLETH